MRHFFLFFLLFLLPFSCRWRDITLPPLPPSSSQKEWAPQRLPISISLPIEKRQRHRIFFLWELFEIIFAREADSLEMARWLSVMDQGGRREGVYRGFVLGREYARFEQGDAPLGDRAAVWTQHFCRRYLGQEIHKDALKKLNFYSVKRIVVERSLELVDRFVLHSREDLHRWYAVLSGEWAENHSAAFKLEMRKKPHKNWHLQWAQGVPLSYLKSELIIKLHRVYHFIGPRPRP